MTTLEIVDWGAVPVDDGVSKISDEVAHLWHVSDRRQQGPLVALRVQNLITLEGGWLTKPAVHPVVLATHRDDQSAEAVLLRLLGGEVLLEELPTAPDSPAVRTLWKAHLVHWHGVTEVGTRLTLDTMREAHAIAHSQESFPSRIPHRHVTARDLNRK